MHPGETIAPRVVVLQASKSSAGRSTLIWTIGILLAFANGPVFAQAIHNTGSDESTANTATTEMPASADRMFGVLPNYSTIEPATAVRPITSKQAYEIAERNTFDPYVFPFVGVVAAMGDRALSYPRRYATSLADNSIGNFLTSAVLPSALHQDPRYFERGSGTVLGRVAYAASRSVITRTDSGRRQFNLSEIGGNAIAAGMSNVYYPSAERTLPDTLTRWGMQVMWDTLSNELKEFWPDVRRKLHHG